MMSKRNKTRRYSYVNAISDLLNKYYEVYETLSAHREGCVSGELFDKINTLLVEDYNNSINNLEYLSKQSMKFLKKKESAENSKIFWYKFRRFFGCKKNDEIELLIQKKYKFKLELANLFENLISSNIRKMIELPEEVTEDFLEEEPDYCEEPDKLFEGPSDNCALFGEVVAPQSLTFNKKES